MAKPGDAYSASSGLNPVAFSNTTPFDLPLPPLPAGKFVLKAKVLVGDRLGANGNAVVCTLRRGQTGSIEIDSAGVRLFGGAPANAGSTATLPLTATVTLTSQDTVKLRCETTSA